MQVTFNKAELLSLTKRVLPAVEKKTTIPIIACFQLTAKENSITLIGTNLENSITITRGASVKQDGTVIVPARKLTDVLAKLKTIDSDDVTITALENHYVSVTCGQLTVKIAGMDAKNFPTLPVFAYKSHAFVAGNVLAGLIDRTKHAICTEESRYTLNGAMVNIGAESIRMIATDGHRLALAEHEGQFPQEMNLLLSRDTLHLLGSLMDNGTVMIARETPDSQTVFFCAGDWQVTARLLTGQFPNWQAVMPKDNRKRITVPAKTLKDAVSRVAQFADARSMATSWELIGGKGLQLSASSSELGDASELLPIPCEDDVKIGFSAAYVSDFLAAVDKKESVTLSIRDSQSAALWTPSEANGFSTSYVLMPMRI
jgi:DNA polymerase-3 subunit beta